MSKGAQRAPHLIGPNAILQFLPIFDSLGDLEDRTNMLAKAGIFDIPDGTSMIPETDAARLHHQLRLDEPEMAPVQAQYVDFATANYIPAHRIPKATQAVLKHLPPGPRRPSLVRHRPTRLDLRGLRHLSRHHPLDL